MEIVINIPDEIIDTYDSFVNQLDRVMRPTRSLHCQTLVNALRNGTILPKGHGRLKDEDEIVKAIEDRVEFLRKNDALFMRLRKDIDILGCIPKIRCEVPTIIEADKVESEE